MLMPPQDAGHYILAKFADDQKTEIHITAFKVMITLCGWLLI